MREVQLILPTIKQPKFQYKWLIELKMQNFNSFGKKKCENLRNKWVNEEISGRCCLSFCLRLFDQWALLFVQSCNNVMQSKDAGVALLCGFVFSDLRLFNEWTLLFLANDQCNYMMRLEYLYVFHGFLVLWRYLSKISTII